MKDNMSAISISEAFDLPRPEDIRAMGFVVKLQAADLPPDKLRQLVDDYVITPAVERELPRILDDMKQVFDRGEEYGRFIHGSFGSGKSHLMSMLSLLLEGSGEAWRKFRPLFAAHREALRAKGKEPVEHEAWLNGAGLLVVRIHMLTVRGKTTGLDRAVYEGFNEALKRKRKEPFVFVNAGAVFEEVRREAEAYGDIVWKRLEAEGIVGGKDEFEALSRGSVKGQETFARSWLKYKGRNLADAGLDPRWSEGLRRMGEHAKAQGFGGIVLLIDEFLLWLAEKSGQEFVQEINSLNVIVDHATGQRPLPIFVFVARQRNLQEFFPDLMDESKIHEHLDHHAKRFEVTMLQDVELRHIVRGRVLRIKNAKAVEEATRGLAEKHSKVLPALLAGADIAYLKDVYPFHPALIEMLVDVTSLMQRERSALRLLYELLVLHYPGLRLGEFLPVGSAFEAIFPASGVEASKKVELMLDIHHQYYTRLVPAMKAVCKELTPDRLRALDQFVKTVLLGEVSPRLRQDGLTIERLVQLNSADVDGETFRGQVGVALTDLLALSQYVPDLQVMGSGKSAQVRYVLGRVSLTEVLGRARSKVDTTQQRFSVFWTALKKALGLLGSKGFEEGEGNEGDWDLSWRKTRRRGRVKLCNIREAKNEDFEPPADSFKVLVDYPWDEPGHTVDEDRLRAANARKHRGNLYTVCWLPRHMSAAELGVLTELAAVRYLMSGAGQEDLLSTLSSADKAKLLDQAGHRQSALEGQLDELLTQVYKHHGEFYALISDLDGSRPGETLSDNLVHIATLLLDRRYAQHPNFSAEPKKGDLELLLKWMVEAGEANTSVAYDEATGKVLKNLGVPLELVNQGQTKATLRLDTRYIKDVMSRVESDSVKWTPVAEHLRDHFGFQPLVIDLFLCFLCQRDHRALQEVSGEPVEVRLGMPATANLRLQRGKVLSVAEWGRLRDLGNELFGVERPSTHRSLQAQDRFAGVLKQRAKEKRDMLQALHGRLVALGVKEGERLRELGEANTRLAGLVQASTDSFKVLADFLGAFPEESSMRARAVVRDAARIRDALGELNEHGLEHLRLAGEHPSYGVEIGAHLDGLNERLSGSDSLVPLGVDWIRSWNDRAQKLIKSILDETRVTSAKVSVSTASRGEAGAALGVPQVSGGGKPREILRRALNRGDADAVAAFLSDVRKALESEEAKTLAFVLSCEEEGR